MCTVSGKKCYDLGQRFTTAAPLAQSSKDMFERDKVNKDEAIWIVRPVRNAGSLG